MAPVATNKPALMKQSTLNWFKAYAQQTEPPRASTPSTPGRASDSNRSTPKARFPFEKYSTPRSPGTSLSVNTPSKVPLSPLARVGKVDSEGAETRKNVSDGENAPTSDQTAMEQGACLIAQQPAQSSGEEPPSLSVDSPSKPDMTESRYFKITPAASQNVAPPATQTAARPSQRSPSSSRYRTASPGEPPPKRLKSTSGSTEPGFHDAKEEQTQINSTLQRAHNERSSSVLSPPPSSLLTSPPASSIPATALPTASTGTKRVVRSSDSGEDGVEGDNADADGSAEQSGDDSDSSLLSLDVLFSKIRKDDSGRMKTRSKTSASARKNTMYRFLNEPPKPKFDCLKTLDDMALQQSRDEALEEEIFRAEAGISGLTNPEDDPEIGNIDKDLLESIVSRRAEDPEGETSKVFQAMHRVDAFGTSMGWSAITNPPSPAYLQPPPFPDCCRSVAPFDDGKEGPADAWRHQVLLTDQVNIDRLPEYSQIALMQWLWDSACTETDSMRSHSILRLLRRSGQRIQTIVNTEEIRSLFQNLGSCPSALDLSTKIVPHRVPRDTTEVDESASGAMERLQRAFGVLAAIADGLDEETRSYALSVLFRLGSDRGLARSTRVLSALRRSVHELTSSVTPDAVERTLHDIGASLYDSVEDTTLQERLLAAIDPISSPHLGLFRRRLALAFLLRMPDALDIDLASAERPQGQRRLTSKIVKHLRSDDTFHVFTHDVDYVKLSSAVAILDIAIGNGFVESAPQSSDDSIELDYATLANQREDQFNKSVDELVDALDSIAARIMDSGATHMSRSDAKVALLRLSFRLQHTVRTKPKPRRKVFAEDLPSGARAGIHRGVGLFDLNGQKQPQRDFMNGFLAKNGAASLSKAPLEITAAD